LEAASIAPLSWEDVISTIGTRDADARSFLADFYARCLQFNAPPRRQPPNRDLPELQETQ